ncbi:MAG: hypothetical protein HY908_22450 [Myxococcales bacterium]|nr:hypothetical protein [Myxococcales bacterium]
MPGTVPVDSFVHDPSNFEPAAEPSGLALDDAESRYGALYSEAIAAGPLGPEKRSELASTAASLGLDAARVARIEQALAASREAQSRPAALEAPRGRAATLAPFDAADDQRMALLQARITLLEEELAKARGEVQSLTEQNAKLDQMLHDFQDAVTRSVSPAVAAALDPLRVAGLSPDVTRPASGDEPSPASRRAIRRGDPALIHRELRSTPRDVELLHALYRSLGRADDLDRRFCIASALVHLGKANDEEREIWATHAHAGLVRPKRAVNEDEWNELLLHPAQDRLTGAILADVAVAALLGQLTALKGQGKRPALDPAYKVDPAKTTSDAARSVAWAAAVLGLRVPPIYVAPGEAFAIELVLGQAPSTRIGTKLFGRTPRELAFVAGRHMCWYRREHVVAKLVPERRQLEDLFLAALMLGNPGMPITQAVKTRIEPVARAMAPLVDKPTLERLAGHFAAFVEQGGRTNLFRWLDTVDASAACAGLLLSGDLAAAHAMLELEESDAPAPADPALGPAPRLEERIDELLVYITAHRFSLLRKRIGVAVVPAP